MSIVDGPYYSLRMPMERNVLVGKNNAVTPHCIHYIVNIIVTVYCIDVLLLLIILIFQCYLYRVMCLDLLNEVVIVHLEINQMTPNWLCVATKNDEQQNMDRRTRDKSNTNWNMKHCYTQLADLGAIFISPLASVTSQLCPLGCTECNDDTLIITPAH